MALQDTLDAAKRFPMPRWPETHGSRQPEEPVNWAWVELWEQENPCPRGEHFNQECFDNWYTHYSTEMDRAWIARALPGFHVWDWSADEVAYARKLIARHACGVCGRTDDPGCTMAC